jgi:hypothetical protein
MTAVRAWTTPKTVGQKLTAAEANNLNDLPMARGDANPLLDDMSIDLGAYDLSVLNAGAGAGRFDIDADYLRLSGSGYPALVARTVTGCAPPTTAHFDPAEYTATAQRHQQVANSANIGYWLALPIGIGITGVTIRLKKGAGAGSLPGTLPSLSLGYYDLTADTFTSLGTQADTSADIATYKTYHAVTLTLGATHTVAASRNYILTLTGDNASTGLSDGLFVYRPVLALSVTSLRAL